MKRNNKRQIWASTGLLALGIVSIGSAPLSSQQPAPPPPPGALGGPLVGLTQAEMNRFGAGANEFRQPENQQTGLGPVFNGVSCVQCHNAGAPGGASNNNVGVSIVTRIGGMVNGQYSDLANLGGPVIQARSLREIIPTYPVPREFVPPQANFVSRRQTTPLFGLGLIEAIPAEAILSRSNVPQGNGVMGMANMVNNPATGQTEVGRFGWKAAVSSIHVFSSDAYLNEMGITSQLFALENLPSGQPIPNGADIVPDPEDEAGAEVQRLDDFQRFSAAPTPLPDTETSARGRKLFANIGCNLCHVPSFTTGVNQTAALSLKQVNLYSDLLLHDMGPGLADGIRQGQANGNQWRTAPLWGLRFRPVYLHDGRATTIDAAIRAHGGEAARTRNTYLLLNRTDRENILEFLSRL